MLKANENDDYLVRYDDKCKELHPNACIISITPTADLTQPKIYYKIENFYANHKSFVKSKSFKQLRGNILDSGSVSSCDPIETMKDLDS